MSIQIISKDNQNISYPYKLMKEKNLNELFKKFKGQRNKNQNCWIIPSIHISQVYNILNNKGIHIRDCANNSPETTPISHSIDYSNNLTETTSTGYDQCELSYNNLPNKAAKCIAVEIQIKKNREYLIKQLIS